MREVLDELVDDHPHEAPANLRALAELYVTAERLSEWVAGRRDGGIAATGKVAPAVLEARKAWVLYLEKARELGITGRAGVNLPACPRIDVQDHSSHVTFAERTWPEPRGTPDPASLRN